jgi:hypothetical protein
LNQELRPCFGLWVDAVLSDGGKGPLFLKFGVEVGFETSCRVMVMV